ncbi:MAG TPA: biopolymer transporter ExbD [Cytophagaceae bacterium]|jgi:biopolymer transport protein ExbD
MAEVSTGGGGGGKGKKRSKKVSTKIDMTPMVDLAFLLITFFMLTTTFNKPQTMEVNMPDKNKDKQDEAPIKASHAITIILGENDKVYWFQGSEEQAPVVELSDYSANGIRKVLLKKNKEIGEKFVVVIKSMEKARYKNVVDILDEMTITDTKRYAIVKILPEDLELVKNL